MGWCRNGPEVAPCPASSQLSHIGPSDLASSQARCSTTVSILCSVLLFCFSLALLGMEPRALYMLSKGSMSELQTYPTGSQS